MNATEVKNLLIKISAYKPAQQLNLLTAPAWLEALAEYPYPDADRAVIELAAEVDWIGINDVAKRIKHYRAERVERGYADLIPPSDLTPADYTLWARAARKRLAAGETATEVNGGRDLAQLSQRNMRSILPGWTGR